VRGRRIMSGIFKDPRGRVAVAANWRRPQPTSGARSVQRRCHAYPSEHYPSGQELNSRSHLGGLRENSPPKAGGEDEIHIGDASVGTADFIVPSPTPCSSWP